jgi:hypothetical protein
MIADSTQFGTGLAAAEGKLRAFAASAGRNVAAPLSVISAPIKIAEDFLRPIQSAISAIPGIGAALAAVPVTAAGFVAFLKSGVEDIARMGREARRTGLSITDFSALTAGALREGLNPEALTAGLTHLSRVAGQESLGIGGRSDRFKPLLGVSGKDFAAMGTEKQLEAIAERYKALGDQGQRNALIMDTLGRQGMGLANIFEHGAQGIKDMYKYAAESGQLITPEELSRVEQADRSMKELEGLVRGVKTTATIEIVSSFSGVFRSTQDLANFQAQMMGFKDFGKEIKFALEVAFGPPGPQAPAPEAPKTDVALEEADKRFTQLRESLAGETAALGKGAHETEIMRFQQELLDQAINPKKVQQMTAELRGLASVSDFGKLQFALDKQIRTYGMSADAVKLWEFSLTGASKDSVAGLEAQVRTLDRLKEGMESVSEAGKGAGTVFGEFQQKVGRLYEMRDKEGLFKGDVKGFQEQLHKLDQEAGKAYASRIAALEKEGRTPFEKLRDSLAEIQGLEDRGLSKLAADAAQSRALKEASGSLGTIHAPEAALKDTAAAVNAIIQSQQPRASAEQQLLQIQQQSQLQLQRIAEEAAATRRALEKLTRPFSDPGRGIAP